MIRHRGLDYDDADTIEMLYVIAIGPAPQPRGAQVPCRWSAEMIERLRQAQIHAAWRQVTGRRKIRLGLGELLDWDLGGRR